MTDVEIFSIGDELLRGLVMDTNSHWMAKRVAARGAALRRVVVLPDDPPTVAAELRAALDRAPGLILTQGGLGPTDDDRTREAVALATGREAVRDPRAERIVRERYAALAAGGHVADAAMTPSRLRMADLPRGAVALDNRIGGAPGVLLETGGAAIVCLPGVPQELWWIWEHSLAGHLDRILGPGGFCEITVVLSERDESRIAEAMHRIAMRHPRVYVKSRASAFDQPDARVRATLTASAPSDEAARSLAQQALGELREALDALQVRIERQDPA
ncbi:MAG TPA: competence/damage-inducible protein A [Actinomycetota bacterium]